VIYDTEDVRSTGVTAMRRNWSWNTEQQCRNYASITPVLNLGTV